MTTRVLALTATAWLVFGSVDTGLPWSEEGVKLFLEKAIDSLDKPLKQFYEDREVTIVETTTDPTIFPPRLLFEVDRLEPFPFADLPASRERDSPSSSDTRRSGQRRGVAREPSSPPSTSRRERPGSRCLARDTWRHRRDLP